jgi:type II secretory ATPase GspE/PulE/Tfp pilus assembly ATPase PilB-like protein
MSFGCRKRATLLRVALIVAVAALLLTMGAGQLLADEWPAFPLPKGPTFRGPGFYLNWLKILACWSVFLLWVKSCDWASTDCQDLKLDYLRWNPILVGSFFATFVLIWLIPSFPFFAAFPLLLIAYIAPFVAYVVYRNGKVDNNRRVFTKEHLRYWFATRGSKVGVKMQAERLDPHEAGPPVRVFGQSGIDSVTDNARLGMARQSPGLLTAREILAEGLAVRATAFMLDYTQQAAAIRTMIDGVWIPGEPRDRETADPALEAIKLLCGLNPQDRQSRQEGTFALEHQSQRYVATFVSQGTSGGERALIQFVEGKIPRRTLDELGMRSKLQTQLGELLELPRGFVFFSAIPGGGLKSTMDAVLHHCDRFTREFATLEEEANRYQEVENIPATMYNVVGGQPLPAVLAKFFRTEPNVVVIRDLVDGEMIEFLCEQIHDDRLILSTVRATDCADALMQVLALGAPQAEFAKSISGVVNQRLIRKLCDSCKEAYAPAANVLQQLGIPEGRVQALYRPFQPNPQEPPKEPCQACGGIGYLGRTAIFELMAVGNEVRRVLSNHPTPEAIRRAARKEGMKSLQEEGVLLVAKGVTSLPELMRVLKQ